MKNLQFSMLKNSLYILMLINFFHLSAVFFFFIFKLNKSVYFFLLKREMLKEIYFFYLLALRTTFSIQHSRYVLPSMSTCRCPQLLPDLKVNIFNNHSILKIHILS